MIHFICAFYFNGKNGTSVTESLLNILLLTGNIIKAVTPESYPYPSLKWRPITLSLVESTNYSKF